MLSDIGLPGATGIEDIGLIRELAPAAEVVLITAYQDAGRAFEALCAGAVGHLVKSTPLPAIEQALLDVLAGGAPTSPGIASTATASHLKGTLPTGINTSVRHCFDIQW